MNCDKIGKFIATSRKKKGLTQIELADKLNITDRAVSKWERGKGCPDISLLEDLSKILDVSIIELLKGEKIPVYGDGLNVRDWLYVYDHCSAIDSVLRNGKVGEVYNVGGHNEKTNLEITKIILDTMGKDESSIKYVEDRLGHDRRYAIDNNKIQTQLGWRPSVTFEEGIKLTIDWYLNNQDWIKSIENKKAGG